MKHVFALVDCNNFYVSCEKIFNPKLIGKPVVVLSNNDGCVVSRSDEAKALGIKTGTPLFKCRDILKKNKGYFYSSNYSLYGDISQRIMFILRRFSPHIEIYSIDEAFLDFKDVKIDDFCAYIKNIKRTIRQWIGVEVSIGIGPTKTLAKIANHIAKKDPQYRGVFDISAYPDIDSLLAGVAVEDIWGVGRQYKKILNNRGIFNALELKNASEIWVQDKMTIVGLKMVWELKGKSCLALEQADVNKKTIVSSRSFGREVRDISELKEAVSSHVSTALKKLRSQGSIASFIAVFLSTNPFKETPQYSNCAGINLIEASSYTPEFTKKAILLLEAIYKKGYSYKKCGVYLAEIMPENRLQMTLFIKDKEREKNKQLMKLIDGINKRFEESKIHMACEGIDQGWKMKQSFKSGRFTTRWNELLVVK
ncbi:MAG: Y-family DNA polymerase [Candidatus Omnitrophica bacterium]|nr:Y-family DNA polymerase [Candidatus Omnitrophota bacterium]